jgi:hypothetical protein
MQTTIMRRRNRAWKREAMSYAAGWRPGRGPPSREDAVVAHVQEYRFDIGEVALADDQVAADVEHDTVETAFEAAPAQSVAVDFAVTVDRGDEDGVGTGFDGGVDELVLADHDADVDDVEALAREGVLDDLVADSVAIGADHTEDNRFGVHFLLTFLVDTFFPGKKNVRIPRRLKTDVHSENSKSGICCYCKIPLARIFAGFLCGDKRCIFTTWCKIRMN